MTKTRCFGEGKPVYEEYHDKEWGVPSHEDHHLFELLILEGAQAGLSWETVLNKRAGYKAAFHNFDAAKVAVMTDNELEALIHNPKIIRNRLKIFATRRNAIVYLKIQKEFGSFSEYLWSYVNGIPIISNPKTIQDFPVSSKESDALSKDLKKRGMTFVGTTIIYAFMQAVGLINDHLTTCWLSNYQIDNADNK